MKTIYLILISSLIVACSMPKRFVSSKNTEIDDLTKSAIFIFLASKDTNVPMVGKIKIDTSIKLRDSIYIDGSYYFNFPMASNILIDTLYKNDYRLKIPDSLKHHFVPAIYPIIFLKDTATIFQFSPLLRTSQNNIFFLQVYIWSTFYDKGNCFRTAYRRYVKFKVHNHKVNYLETILSSNPDHDFIGVECQSQ